MKIKAPPYILEIEPYVPGKPVEELAREYGVADAVKLASNENPLGSSPMAIEAIAACLSRLHRYPDGAGYELVEKLASANGLGVRNIVLGNGSDEILAFAARALLSPGDEAVMPTPSFLMYEITVRASGGVPVFVPLNGLEIDLKAMARRITEKTRLVFVCNPNNPTGTVVKKPEMDAFIKELPDSVVTVIDEAYVEFVSDPACAHGPDYLFSDRAVVTLRTFSKVYGLAGLRIGYAMVPEILWDLFNRVRPPFNASIPAQAGAVAALKDTAFLKETVQTVHQGLAYLKKEVEKMGLRCFSSQANFFLIDLDRPADPVFEALLRQGVIVRSMRSYGYPTYIRVTAGLPAENERFVAALGRVCGLREHR